MIACPSCGNENADDAAFCGFCGAKLHADGPSKTLFGVLSAVPPADAAAATPAAVPAAEPEPSPAPAPEPVAPEPVATTAMAAVPGPAAATTPEPEPAAAPVPTTAMGAVPGPAKAPGVKLDDLSISDTIDPDDKLLGTAAGAKKQQGNTIRTSRAATKDKADEEKFFGASLSKFDLEGINPDELIDNEPKKGGSGGLIIAIILLILIGGGAAAYFLVLN